MTVSRGLLGLEVTGDVIEVEHSASRIVAATPDGAVLATVDAAQKTNSSSMTETFVVLPEELRRTTDVEPAQPTPSTTVAPTPARGPTPDVLSDVARVSFDLTGWKPSFDDDGSLGFVTVDVLGTVEDDAQPCRTMRCLADKVVWLPRGGYDDETGELVLSPYRFEIVGVRSAFEIRCGRRGGWTSSRADTSGHSARCVFDSVEGDVVISLRST